MVGTASPSSRASGPHPVVVAMAVTVQGLRPERLSGRAPSRWTRTGGRTATSSRCGGGGFTPVAYSYVWTLRHGQVYLQPSKLSVGCMLRLRLPSRPSRTPMRCHPHAPLLFPCCRLATSGGPRWGAPRRACRRSTTAPTLTTLRPQPRTQICE